MTSLPVSVQAVKQDLVAGLRRCRLIQHDKIEAGKAGSMVPKRFPDHALQPVPPDCQPAVFFGYRQAEPRFVFADFPVKNRTPLVAAAFCFFEDAAIARSIKKPVSPSEAAVRVCG